MGAVLAPTLDRLPDELRTEAFERLFQACEIGRFEPDVKLRYEKEMITERDYYNTERDYYNMLNTAKADGKAEGLAEGRAMVAKEMKRLGLPTDIIIKSTGLSEAQIAAL